MAAARSGRTKVVLFVLLITHLYVVWGKVGKELPPECREFFYLEVAPVGLEHNSLRFICQRYNKRARFVTLYHTAHRIPIYSAYTFKRSEGDMCADVPWMYEPQLSTPGATDEMQTFPQRDMPMNLDESQAVLDDYMNAVFYERATLNPDLHQKDHDDKASTYTLTNAVPLVPDFNDPVWTTQEDVIRKRLNNYCRGPAYIVTGVSTSGTMIRRENMNRVAVPAYLWSAYCCPLYDHSAPFGERYKFPAYAHYGLNAEEDNQVVEVSVQKLQEFLKKTVFVKQNFQIFSGDCGAPGSS